ncbi:MAG: hypothetical protein Q9212_006869 [Teloschistes hypoglaucus]
MTRTSFSYPPTTCSLLIIISTLLSSVLAIDPPPNTDVTWLYPIVPSTINNNNHQKLTYNTLDTLNVSWTSSRSPAYLNLACQKGDDSSDYTSVLKTLVPAIGNRLVGLSIATGYQACHFELSAPSVLLNISHGVGFEVVDDENVSPVFWTSLLSGGAGANSSNSSSSMAESLCTAAAAARGANDGAGSGGNNNNNNNGSREKYKMIGIGVGVAVGVFAGTTAGWLLVEIQRRKRRREGGEGGEAGDKGSSSSAAVAAGAKDEGRVEEWVRETSTAATAADGQRCSCSCSHRRRQQEGVEGRMEVDEGFGQAQRHEVQGQPVGEMDTNQTGCARQ